VRLFFLERIEDESGVSGVGRVAEGVVFDDGTAALRWLTKTASSAFYNNVSDLEAIHGHHGKTKVVYVEEPDFYPCGCPNTTKKEKM